MSVNKIPVRLGCKRQLKPWKKEVPEKISNYRNQRLDLRGKS